ncbi:MAG: PKD domain-containing protein [Chitinophagales bacterium]|nr:PKD domain-containing protein [Chitinophagales bacterium]
MKKQLYLLLFIGFTGLFSASLHAQCSRVAWVSSVMPGCGAKIVDLDNGETLWAAAGAEGLSGGQIFSFSAEAGSLPPGCSVGNLPVVSLTCVSQQLPCKAVFARVPVEEQLLTYKLVAHLYDPSAQQCSWDFGDGQTGSGAIAEHTYAAEGEYNVCLTVTDNFGCQVQTCQTLTATKADYNWCGFDMQVTAIGTELQGRLIPNANDIDLSSIDSVQWYTNKSSQVISEQPAFSANLPDYGTYTVCATYKVINPFDGSVCYTTQCQTITVAQLECINPTLADPAKLCPSETQLNAPVCGCDGLTYANECEVLASGISTWWAGACGSIVGNCSTKMDAHIISGSPDAGYIAQFVNHSHGNFNYAQLDFGDGSPLLEGVLWDTIVHLYDAGGIYKANFTVWSTSGCISSVTQLIVTDASMMSAATLPDVTDYVMPGDANRDFRANVHDLLNLGVGHYNGGAPRPDAHTNWIPQFAPNWDHTLQSHVNYKHFDCDGNGVVNELDADVINQHYAAIDTTYVPYLPDAPQLRIEFEKDTLVVDPNNPAPVQLSATIHVGSPSKPALGLYGLSFALKYPEYVNHNPDTDYDDDFFGSTNHLLWLAKDVHPRQQLDLGITRKNGIAANGYGKVAKVTFSADVIIIIDVISRGEDKVMPFVVPIRGVKAIDKNGNKFEISVPELQDTIWIKTLQTSKTQEEQLQARVQLSPNPATETATLTTTGLDVASIEVMNSLGQKVRNLQAPTSANTQLDVSGWTSGVYALRILTDEGLVEKKLVVK